MNSQRRFYADLAPLRRFEESTRPERLTPLPGDWHFFMTDVVNSTGAIERGAYRSVNLAGAAGVAAAFNACGRLEIPYVFCGDGAQVAVPGEDAGAVKEALLGVSNLVMAVHGLQLRVGGCAVAQLWADGFELRVGKVRRSAEVDQAVFWGTGLEAVDRLMRGSEVMKAEVPVPDLRGLECRWREVPTDQEEVVSLLVQSALGMADSAQIYEEVLRQVEKVFGEEDVRHPLRPERLSLRVMPLEMEEEVGLRFAGRSAARRLWMRGWSSMENRVGGFLMGRRLKALGVDWGKYFEQVIGHSDCQKFTGMLALTAAGSRASREKLENWLEEQYRAGRLVYGVGVSRASLITCVVLERSCRHYHFVDGADGGYARASFGLKERWRRVGAIAKGAAA